MPEDVARKSGFKLDQPAPIAVIDELSSYDGVMFGTGTRFGNMTAQMKNFLDQAGGLWMSDGLVGKVGIGLHLLGDPAWRPGDRPS